MAYYIFLKSLRSLEEFRKNPHVKIPPKSPTNFQSLGKFKNPILILKFFFPCFRPGQPCSSLGLWPSPPTDRAVPAGRNRPGRPIQPARRSRLRGKYAFLFGSRPPESAASPSSLCQVGPACQLCPPHRADRPRPLSSVTSDHPAPPDLRPRDAQRGIYPTP
jgi:hypothetical protein